MNRDEQNGIIPRERDNLDFSARQCIVLSCKDTAEFTMDGGLEAWVEEELGGKL